MTITTAKRARVRPRLAPVATAVMALLAAPASRAGWDVRPALQVRETFTDNVGLQPKPLDDSQLVTELIPSLALVHRGPRFQMEGLAKLYHYEFSHEQVSGTARTQHEVNARAHAELVDDLLYADAFASDAPRTVSPFGQRVNDANYLTRNRAQVKAWSLSPYLAHRFGNSANAMLRVSHDSVDLGSSGMGNTDADNLLFNLASGSAFRTLGWGLQYSQQNLSDEVAPSISTRSGTGNLRYRASATLSLTATAGYDKYDYNALGGVTEGKSWSAGFIWEPSARTKLEASSGRRFTGTTKTLRALHRSRRTTWNISYDDSITNSRSNFLLPAAVDTAALLDRMFMAEIPDPAQRQLAVANYIRRAGLPASLADSVNYFSNRFYLQKSLNASVGLRGAHSTLVLSGYRTRRNALSTSQSDSALLGSNLSTLNDNVLQKGASASFTYVVSRRTDLMVTRDVYTSESMTAAFETANRALRLRMNHRLGTTLTGALELRRITGTFGFGSTQPFRENAIAASLSYQR